MITSWNVNRNFKAVEAAIKTYLNEDEDLLILHEVKTSDLSKLKDDKYREFMFERPLNKRDGRPDAVTIAIFKKDKDNPDENKPKGKYEVDEVYKDCLLDTFESYNNRVIAVHKTGDCSETIIGIHCPENGIASGGPSVINFWDGLERFHQKMKKWDKALIYIGDINTYEPNTVNKRRMFRFMSEGLVDFWVESGHRHTEPTFVSGTRIDYALVTDKDFKELERKYEMTVDPKDIADKGDKKESLLSDHSAIILKERTPEMKKTGD